MDRAQPPPHLLHLEVGGTKDGQGAGDHDEPYRFGRRPSAVAPWPFSERQYARLLVLRGRTLDRDFAEDQGNEHPIAFLPDGIWVAGPGDMLSDRRAA